jgi:aspartyl protease
MRFGCLWIAAGLAGSCFAAGNSIRETTVAVPQTYRLQLTSLVKPPTGAIGLILKTSVNGGPPLRLLLDTGAEHLVLSRNAARKTGSRSGADVDLMGAGTEARAAHLTTAATVEIGELTLRDCPMAIVDGRLAEGVDGVIPLSLFADYLIHLDVPHKLLVLEPYPSALQTSDPTFVRAAMQQHLLFLPTRVRNAPDGYMLLDTGSTYNVLSNAVTAMLQPARVLTVAAASGQTEARLLPGRLPVRFGGGELMFDSAVGMPLTEISRRNGMDVTGIIGYPAVARSVVTVSYRDSLVRIQGK